MFEVRFLFQECLNVGMRFGTKYSEVGSWHPGCEVERECRVGVDESDWKWRSRGRRSRRASFEEFDEHRSRDICSTVDPEDGSTSGIEQQNEVEESQTHAESPVRTTLNSL